MTPVFTAFAIDLVKGPAKIADVNETSFQDLSTNFSKESKKKTPS